MRRQKSNTKINIENIDIRELLEELDIDYTEGGKNVSTGWIGTSCPFCSDDSNHMGINLENKTISCWKCGTTGTIIKLFTEKFNSFNKALQIINKAIPKELKSFNTIEVNNNVSHVELPKEASRKITPYHAGYLEKRNFKWKEIEDLYNLHYCGPLGKWANRIIVPIVKNYKLVTFTSIDISDETINRYKHLKDELSIIPIKNYLYGMEYTNNYSCCLVEGIFDMFRIGPGAVCGFGTKITSEQKKLLIKYKKVIIAFDGDEAGRKNAVKLANDISAYCDVSILYLPDEKDPDKLGKNEIKFIRNLIGKN